MSSNVAFGNGQMFLAMTLAALNLLAFAQHTVLELLELSLSRRLPPQPFGEGPRPK